MGKFENPVERQIREAIEAGAFDNLPGKGKPLDLENNPFEDPMMPTLRRILRDHGVSHPLVEARKAFESEIEEYRRELRTAWRAYSEYGSSRAVWDQAVRQFRAKVQNLNRAIKLSNLKAPLPNFLIPIVDAGAEIRAVAGDAAPTDS